MQQAVRDGVEHIIPVIEAIGALVVIVGVLIAFVTWAVSEVRSRAMGSEEGVRLTLGRFLALGLEFQLGADILGTAVSPSWDQIGRLGAIAGIRTLLNYFLARELDRSHAQDAGTSPEQRHASGGSAARA